MEDRRCVSGPTASWAHTYVCSRTWRSGTCGTTQTTTWLWVTYAESCLMHTCATLVSGHTLPSSPQRPRMGSTDCSQSSGGKFPGHLGRNAPTRNGFHQKSGISSTPGLQYAGTRTGHSRSPGNSAVILRRISMSTGAEERLNQGLRWSPSSLTIHL